MNPSTIVLHSSVSMLAFFQSTQLSLFEQFLNQAVSGINSTSITTGMQNVAYVVLLVGFLWQVYQSALHGGDVRGLGTNFIKYALTAIVVMNYTTIFTTVNQGFVNAGNWVSNASGAGNLFDNWTNDLQTQFNQAGFQQLWGLITGSIAGLIDGLLIIVAYILYPVVIVIFGFFYIFYGSVLYIFGPIVIALLPLNAASRIARSYIENVFVWNSWPILYGGFGALLSAVQMGQIGQMLSTNNFLGGLGNIEGSFLVGLASIVYSLAIAVIPFVAKRIVSGDVGATAISMMGAAATALTAGVAAFEGAAAGAAAATGSGASGGSTVPAATSGTSASVTSSATANQPAAAQRTAISSSNQPPNANTEPSASRGIAHSREGGGPSSGFTTNEPGSSGADVNSAGSPLGEVHADQIRRDFAALAGKQQASPTSQTSTADGPSSVSASAHGAKSTGSRDSGAYRWSPGSSGALGRRNGIATWGAYHAACLATQGVVSGGRAVAGAGNSAIDALRDPVGTVGRVAGAVGRAAGNVTNAAVATGRAVQAGGDAATHPVESVRRGAESVAATVSGGAGQAAQTIRDSIDAAKTGFTSNYGQTRRDNDRES